MEKNYDVFHYKIKEDVFLVLQVDAKQLEKISRVEKAAKTFFFD